MIIKTNRVPRNIIDAYELTADERKEFDYLNWPAIDEGSDSASFIRYKGQLYDLSEFVITDLEGWDGLHALTYFSGVVIRLVEDDQVVVGLASS